MTCLQGIDIADQLSTELSSYRTPKGFTLANEVRSLRRRSRAASTSSQACLAPSYALAEQAWQNSIDVVNAARRRRCKLFNPKGWITWPEPRSSLPIGKPVKRSDRKCKPFKGLNRYPIAGHGLFLAHRESGEAKLPAMHVMQALHQVAIALQADQFGKNRFSCALGQASLVMGHMQINAGPYFWLWETCKQTRVPTFIKSIPIKSSLMFCPSQVSLRAEHCYNSFKLALLGLNLLAPQFHFDPKRSMTKGPA
eukprot:TRINITY_DN26947_c0_g1_i1.p1 TRINITY_DN26947_c0_g1~~TRINITY_DN26947_c0_g1_i1.p1  ORF type:complete len:253 (-),score=5.92 TRINITY_DN26947_c0_g1_i1:53-811(-)